MPVPRQPVQVRTVAAGEPGWDDFVRLLDDYRAHYGRARDPVGLRRWLGQAAVPARVRCYLAEVAADDGVGRPAAVGMALVSPSPATMTLSELWSLRDLFVDADHRGAGVGRALVGRVRDDASAAGASRLVLQTEHDNTVALSLYRSLGFSDQHGYVPLSLAL